MLEGQGTPSEWSHAAQPTLHDLEALLGRDGFRLLNSQILERVIGPSRTLVHPLKIQIDNTSLLQLRLDEVQLPAESRRLSSIQSDLGA